jgi:type I restriction enzyme S subunit
MIAGLTAYIRYKESGHAWVGRVPEHWSLLPNRALFAEIKDRGHSAEEMLSVTITRGVIQQKALLADSSKKDGSNRNRSAYKLVCPGDIAYNKMRAWQGAIGMSQHRGIISPAYVVQRPRGDSNPRYFHWLFRTPHFAKEAERWSYGITSDMWSLRPEHFKMIYCAVPPREEQDAIVRLLDHVNLQMERAIRAKKKLIALLNEQRQAIIHRAVTHGLDPNVLLKPSGVSWLGGIPEHWEIKRITHVASLITGFPFPSSGFSQSDGDVRLLRGINVTPGAVRWQQVVRWPLDASGTFGGFQLKAGDIVIGMDRPIINGGTRVAVLAHEDVPALLLQRVARLRPLPGHHRHFLAFLLSGKAFQDYLAPVFTGVSVPHISPRQIGGYRCAFPPEEEQQRIVDWIIEHTFALNTSINHAQKETDLLREYRTRLTADVVTGKLDVREAAMGLPAVVEESEAGATSEDEAEELQEAVADDE